MHRVPLICLIALAVLALPASASALTSWPIYDAAHHRSGSVQKGNATTASSDWDKAVATVWQNTTMVRYCGKLTYVWTENGRVKNMWDFWDTNALPLGSHVSKLSAGRYDVKAYQAKGRYWRTVGRAVRGGSGPWRLEKRVGAGYQKVGSAPGSCPGYDAAAGGYLLLLFGALPAD